MTTVLLVDDHDLIRDGLTGVFSAQPDMEVVGAAATVTEAIALYEQLSPQVVVTDLQLQDGTGLDVVRRVRRDDQKAGLVVLTMHAGDDQIFAALEAGASAFVLKGAPADDVVSSARQAASAPTAFTAQDLAGAMRRRMQGPSVRLTPRENEILQLLASGASVAQLSSKLYISQSTAKTHMSKLYDKLGAANRTQAVMTAVRLGLLSTEAT